MSDESTMSQNNLLADVLKWKQRYREAKAQVETLTKANAELQAQKEEAEANFDALNALTDEYEAKINATPDEMAAKVKELEKELWTRDTRAKFEKVAKDAKVRDEALGDLWSLLGVDPEKDAEIDDAAIAERVGEAVKARSYLLQSDPATGNGAAVPQQGQTAKPEAKPPGPGLSRGAPERGAVNDPRAAAIARVQQATGQANPFRVA
jgi:hypothetical protein